MDEVTAMASLLAISEDFETIPPLPSAVETAAIEHEAQEERNERSAHLKSFLAKALSLEEEDENDDLYGGLPKEEYLRDLPLEVRRPYGSAIDIQSGIKLTPQSDADSATTAGGEHMEALDESAASIMGQAERARKQEERLAAKSRENATILSGSAALDLDPAAVEEFESYVRSLPPDVRQAVRDLQDLGLLRADGSGGSQVETEHYRAYLELLSGTTDPLKADPAARVAAAQAVEAISGIKRKRPAEGEGNGAPAPASTPASVTAEDKHKAEERKRKQLEAAILDSLS